MKNKIWSKDSHNILEQATSLENYNHWLISQFQSYLGKNILELGAGLGGISRYLPTTSKLTLSDLRSDYFSYLKNKFNCETLKLDIEKEKPLNLRNKFDTIFSSNVFEHIKDDQQAFNNSYSLLKKGGKFLLFVPACPGIYGELDKDMGHYRRYTVDDAKNKALKAGFKIIEIKYVNLFGYFAWWGRGVLLGKIIKSKPGKSSTDSFLAEIYDSLIVPLLNLEKLFKAPFGQSLLLVAEKV